LQLSKSRAEISFVVMDTFSSYRNSSLRCAKRARKLRFLTAGLLIISVAALSCLLFFTKSWRSKLKAVELSAKDPVAELVSTTGVVLRGSDNRHFMELERIIAFGRSLELIGTVEAGSRLVVNDEIVDISGDGSFKHFTKPFPVSAKKALLVMKVMDLAGRTRTETIAYEFNPRGRKN